MLPMPLLQQAIVARPELLSRASFSLSQTSPVCVASYNTSPSSFVYAVPKHLQSLCILIRLIFQ